MPTKKAKQPKETKIDEPMHIRVVDPTEKLENRIKRLEKRHRLLDDYVDEIAIRVIEEAHRLAFIRALILSVLILTAVSTVLTLIRAFGWI